MKQILLVEGNDDKHVFWAIFEKHKVEGSFEVIDTNGIDNLLIDLPSYLKTDNDTIGIVIDADTNIQSRWNSIKNILKDFEYTLPNELEATGTILRSNDWPTIGLWIMPNNNTSGMLEDFVSVLIPNENEILPFVNETLESLEINKLNNYKPIHKSKARIHTWLAWQENPGTPMGLAITRSFLNANNELCNLFINWINKLFNP